MTSQPKVEHKSDNLHARENSNKSEYNREIDNHSTEVESELVNDQNEKVDFKSPTVEIIDPKNLTENNSVRNETTW